MHGPCGGTRAQEIRRRGAPRICEGSKTRVEVWKSVRLQIADVMGPPAA